MVQQRGPLAKKGTWRTAILGEILRTTISIVIGSLLQRGNLGFRV